MDSDQDLNQFHNNHIEEGISSHKITPENSQPNNQQEDDLNQAAQNLNDFDELCELVSQFESAAFDTKKKIIGLDRGSQQCNILPQTLKMCFQILSKFIAAEKPHFDMKEQMETSISEALHNSAMTNKEFSKFKGEFFAVCDPIVNKDLVTLKLATVKQQLAKQEKLLDKISMIQMAGESNQADLVHLKERYETFQKDLFAEKQESIDVLGKQADDIIQQVTSLSQEVLMEIQDAQKQSKGLSPQTKEQISCLSEIQGNIQKIDRRFKKWMSNQQSIMETQRTLRDKCQTCRKILDSMQPEPLNKMINQTNQIEKFLDCQKTLEKFVGKIEGLLSEIMAVQGDIQQIQISIQQFQGDLKSQINTEFNDLIDQINAKSEKVQNQVEEQISRLDAFEKKILEVKISDADQFFLNKEIMRFRNALNSIESQRDLLKDQTFTLQQKSDPIQNEDLNTLKSVLKQLSKQEEYELPKQAKNIDGLDQFVMKALMVSFRQDTKMNMNIIQKIKKRSEELNKKYEGLVAKYDDSSRLLQSLNKQFEGADLERYNEIEALEERLLEEAECIGGHCCKAKEGDANDSRMGNEESIYRLRRNIVPKINSLVEQCNQLIKEGKDNKSEQAMSEIIQRTRSIQDECNEVMQSIEDTKQLSDDILNRLNTIINQDTVDKLTHKYNQKQQIVEDCEKLAQRAQQISTQLKNSVNKQNETMTEIIAKLDLYNPINNANTSNDEEFMDKISQKIEESNRIKDELETVADSLVQFQEKIEQNSNPLKEMGDREVLIDPEIERIRETFNDILQELAEVDAQTQPKAAEIAKIQKSVKELLDSEIENRIKDGQGKLEILEKEISDCMELLHSNQKKLKYYKDEIERAERTYGQNDSSLLGHFAELLDEVQKIEKQAADLEVKVKDIKSKKDSYRKNFEQNIKNLKNLQPNQIENWLNNMDELREICQGRENKLQQMDKLIDQRVLEFESLISSSTSKQELSANIQELNTEIEQEVTNLGELLDKLPLMVKSIKATVLEMREGTNPDDDYFEKKEEIEEQLEEIQEVSDNLDRYRSQFDLFKKGREQIKANIKKASTAEQLHKINDQLGTQKNELTELFTNALECQEELEDIKRDIGDCDIPTNIEKRKQEVSKFSNRLDRMTKELQNLKKANKDEKIDSMVKAVDFKLNVLAKARKDLNKLLADDLENLKQVEFEDFNVNFEIVKRVRKLKNTIEDTETKLKDAEEIQNEVVRTLSEKDIDSSADVLGLKAQELRERLHESKVQLKKIAQAGEQMDGNTSNGEEEEFVVAIKKEMPETIENIEIELNKLKDVEKLVAEVKQTLNVDKMTELKKKVGIASENVDESESLVNKLHLELLEWNAQKKLFRRDQELDEIQLLCADFFEDLSTEKMNTEIELEKNREKQEENKGQDMVDKDGNKVDIMQDLIKLEGQMNSYLMEIDAILELIKHLETQKDDCLNDFNAEIPKIVMDQRKKRHAENAAAKSRAAHLKRPPQLGAVGPKKKGEEGREEQLDIYKMLATNCKFKKTIHKLLEDLKGVNKQRKELEENYSQMRREVFKIKQIKLYKPVVGDVVDEMFAGYLNKAKLTIEVQRISASNYMFGTKKILAKIINGRLVIRVGGGYMNAEEFIEQYGKIEMMKMMKIEETKNAQGYQTEEKPKSAAPADENRKKQMGAEIKEKMRQSMMKMITPYQTHQTNTDGSLAQSIRKQVKMTNDIKGRNSVMVDQSEELKSALQLLRNTNSVSQLQLKLPLPERGANSPNPSKGKESARTPLNQHKGGKETKSPKSSVNFFNNLKKKEESKNGAHTRRGTIAIIPSEDNLRPKGNK